MECVWNGRRTDTEKRTAAAPTFCKCSCFTNSTIIPLGPHNSAGSGTPPEIRGLDNAPLDTRASSASCSQCNRAFCLDYNLPICKGAEEKDVVAMCFQRDSRKDQIIVWGFIIGTTGLLGWTAVQHAMQLRASVAASRSAAAGVGGVGGDGDNGNGPILGHAAGRGGSGGGNVFQQVAARVGLGRRGDGGDSDLGRRSPLSSPLSAGGPRGQYAALGGSSGE